MDAIIGRLNIPAKRLTRSRSLASISCSNAAREFSTIESFLGSQDGTTISSNI
jgi:hypothetical protein